MTDTNPESLKRLVAAVQRTGTVEYKGVIVQRVVRIPLHLSASIDALKDKTGMSRNALMTEVLELGIDVLMAKLPEREYDIVKSLVHSHFQAGTEDAVQAQIDGHMDEPNSLYQSGTLDDFQLEKTQ
jgi:hypothetical protein